MSAMVDYFAGRRHAEDGSFNTFTREVRDLLQEHQASLQARFDALMARQEEVVGGLLQQQRFCSAANTIRSPGPTVVSPGSTLNGFPSNTGHHVHAGDLHIPHRHFQTALPTPGRAERSMFSPKVRTSVDSHDSSVVATKHQAAAAALQNLSHSGEPSGPLAKAYLTGHKAYSHTSLQDLSARQASLQIPKAKASRMSRTHPAMVPEERELAPNVGVEEANIVECSQPLGKKKKWKTRMEAATHTGSASKADEDELNSHESEEFCKWCPCPRCMRILKRIGMLAKEPTFDIVCGVAVLGNAILIGAETEYIAQHGGSSHHGFVLSQLGLNIWFTIELMMRILADNCRFFTSSDWKWNIFDSILVVFSIIDVVQVAFVGVANIMVTGRLMRIIRLSRVVRTLRLCRTLAYIHEFRKMVYSLQASIMTLLWSLLLLFSVMFAFSILFVQGVTEHLILYESGELPPEDIVHVGNLRMDYGSLYRGCVTLYKAISNGVSWGSVMEPLGTVDPSFVALFLCYISISFFGVLNVVSAVFVESAMASAAHYKDLRIYESRKAKTELVRHMREVFKQIDEDESGEISFEEMDHFLTDPQLKMYVESLEVTVEDTAMLFQLMDLDDSGVVDIEEFCSGLMRLQGDARSFDVHLLIFEMSKFQTRWDKFVTYVEFMFDEVIDSVYNQEFAAKAMQQQGRPTTSSSHSRLSANAFFTAEERKLCDEQHAKSNGNGTSGLHTTEIMVDTLNGAKHLREEKARRSLWAAGEDKESDDVYVL